MAASPRYALVAIAAPNDVDAAWVMELVGGMRDACAEYALALVGGDTNRADLVVVSVAVVGEVAPGRAVLRSGARVGDRIVVTGSLGAAAGGLALSRAASGRAAEALSQPWGRALIEALERPVARVGEAQMLARAGATAMMDLSDGLAKDLSRLCEASGVGARVVLAAVPVAEPLSSGAAMLEVDAAALALAGGEDYELLATLPADAVERAREELRSGFGVDLSEIGEIVAGPGIVGRGRRRRDGAARTRGMGSLRPRVAWSRGRRRSAAATASALDRRLRLGRRCGDPGGSEDLQRARRVRDDRDHGRHDPEHPGRDRLRTPPAAGRRRADPRGRDGHRGRCRQDRDAGLRGDRRGGRRRRCRDADREPRRGSGLGLQARPSPARRGRRRRAPRTDPAARDARHAEPARGRGPGRARGDRPRRDGGGGAGDPSDGSRGGAGQGRPPARSRPAPTTCSSTATG